MKAKTQKKCRKILKRQSLKPQLELPYRLIGRFTHYLNITDFHKKIKKVPIDTKVEIWTIL